MIFPWSRCITLVAIGDMVDHLIPATFVKSAINIEILLSMKHELVEQPMMLAYMGPMVQLKLLLQSQSLAQLNRL
jgi:hypothetical protein